MNRKLFAIALFIAGIIGIILILWWAFQPTLPGAPRGTTSGTTSTQSGQLTFPDELTTPVRPDPGSPEEQERQAQEALKRQASLFAARYGSHSNNDNFTSWRLLGIEITAGVQPFLQSEQQRLSKEYPAFKGYWGQTTKSLSSKITSPLPLLGKADATVTVQVQQTIETTIPDAKGSVTYAEITLGFKNVNGKWLVLSITSQPLAL